MGEVESGDQALLARERVLRPRVVRPVTYLEAVPSGTGPIRFVADDGQQYWLKAPHVNDRRTLIPERVVAGLAKLLEVPSPEAVLVEIGPEIRWKDGRGRTLIPGIGHASRHVEEVAFERESARYADRDGNRTRLAKIGALWDLCFGTDAQWMHDVPADYAVATFDHNLWLGFESDLSLQWLERYRDKQWPTPYDLTSTSKSALFATALRLDGLESADFMAVVRTVPLEWETDDREMARLGALLYHRAEAVSARLRSAAARAKFA